MNHITAKSGEENPCEQNKDILLPLKKDIIYEKTTQKGLAEAAKKIKQTHTANRDSRVCNVIKADETSRLYRAIDYYVAIDANTRAETIEKNIDDLVKKSGDLEKAIGEVTKSIMLIKDKVKELKAKACDLDTQVQDSCNSQQLAILNPHFAAKCRVSDPNGKESQYPDFSSIIQSVSKKTGFVFENVDKASNTAVSIAGIQSFSHIKSLKEISKLLTLSIKDFKKDIDSNIKSGDDELKKAHDELAKSVKEVTLKSLDEHKESVKYEGVAFTLDFFCNPNCEGEKDIKEICCEVMKTFCEKKESDACGEYEKYDYRLKNID